MSGSHIPDDGGNGYVYLAAIRKLNRVKLGRTWDLRRRLGELETKLRPHAVELVSYMICACDHHRFWEKWYHRRLAHARIDGEWFRLDDGHVQAVIALWKDELRRKMELALGRQGA